MKIEKKFGIKLQAIGTGTHDNGIDKLHIIIHEMRKLGLEVSFTQCEEYADIVPSEV
jgi:hypothetical protein